jgi:hypothetical protein
MIGSPKPQCDDATRRNVLTANRQVLFGNPKEKRNGGIETDRFFDSAIDQRRIFFQFLQLVRMRQQCIHRIGNQVCGGQQTCI